MEWTLDNLDIWIEYCEKYNEDPLEKDNYIVYILESISTKKIYIGKTNDIDRRLRQHNGEIVGGAKKTQKDKPWRLAGIISGSMSNRMALQLEWRLQHPYCGKSSKSGKSNTKKQIKRRRGRVLRTVKEDVQHVLSLRRWTSNSCNAEICSCEVKWLL